MAVHIVLKPPEIKATATCVATPAQIKAAIAKLPADATDQRAKLQKLLEDQTRGTNS